MRLSPSSQFEAHLERVVHEPGLPVCGDRPHPFSYSIRLENHASEALVVLGRKWIVTGTSGQVLVVEGEGVVGETPVIEPGGCFRYESYLSVAEDSQVAGSYYARMDSGDCVLAVLPVFTISIRGL